MRDDVFKKFEEFLLLENNFSPSVMSYIQSIQETLSTISPRTTRDYRRIEVAKDNIREIARMFKRMNEEMNTLREQVKLLENKNEH